MPPDLENRSCHQLSEFCWIKIIENSSSAIRCNIHQASPVHRARTCYKTTLHAAQGKIRPSCASLPPLRCTFHPAHLTLALPLPYPAFRRAGLLGRGPDPLQVSLRLPLASRLLPSLSSLLLNYFLRPSLLDGLDLCRPRQPKGWVGSRRIHLSSLRSLPFLRLNFPHPNHPPGPGIAVTALALPSTNAIATAIATDLQGIREAGACPPA